MSHSSNIMRIMAVNEALGALKGKVVFVGGATVSLYADRQVFEARPTHDVDVIIEITNYTGRALLEEQLRSLGFAHDMESSIICRYRINDFVVDIMPTNDPSIGFTNKWYPEGFKRAVEYQIDESSSIRILSTPFFIATKLEAFKGRGNGDGRTSHDFEDIIYILENRRTVWEELNNSDEEVRKYLQSEISKLVENPYISEWIDSHIERNNPESTNSILEKLNNFCSN